MTPSPDSGTTNELGGPSMEIILTPFVWLLQVFYDWCGSYGLALILFAIVASAA